MSWYKDATGNTGDVCISCPTTTTATVSSNFPSSTSRQSGEVISLECSNTSRQVQRGEYISLESRQPIFPIDIQNSEIDLESLSGGGAAAGGGICFSNLYEIVAELGEGAQGKVFQCQSLTTTRSDAAGKPFAVKAIPVTEKNKSRVENEMMVMKKLNQGVAQHQQHQNHHVIWLQDVVEEPAYTYLVMELMVGGDLNNRIRSDPYFSEADTQLLCKSLFQAIRFCHERNIAHRDIKPANMLLPSKQENLGSVKIADFGYAKVVPQTGLTTWLGTPPFMAPEVILTATFLLEPYNAKCDMWSVGVVVYQLLVGEYPFSPDPEITDRKEQLKDLSRKIARCSFDKSNPRWRSLSMNARNLILKLLTNNHNQRYSAQEAMDCAWMQASNKALRSERLIISSVEESIDDQLLIPYMGDKMEWISSRTFENDVNTTMKTMRLSKPTFTFLLAVLLLITVGAVVGVVFLKNTPDSSPEATCGGGRRGNGVCSDGLCCSPFGWCGPTTKYCDSGSPLAHDALTCGNGVRGNGTCLDGTCCSQYGWCGATPEHCAADLLPTAAPTVVGESPPPIQP